MTTLSDPLITCVVDLRYNSNTQWDFLTFINYAIDIGYLTQGDVLVVRAIIETNLTKIR